MDEFNAMVARLKPLVLGGSEQRAARLLDLLALAALTMAVLGKGGRSVLQGFAWQQTSGVELAATYKLAGDGNAKVAALVLTPPGSGANPVEIPLSVIAAHVRTWVPDASNAATDTEETVPVLKKPLLQKLMAWPTAMPTGTDDALNKLPERPEGHDRSASAPFFAATSELQEHNQDIFEMVTAERMCGNANKPLLYALHRWAWRAAGAPQQSVPTSLYPQLVSGGIQLGRIDRLKLRAIVDEMDGVMYAWLPNSVVGWLHLSPASRNALLESAAKSLTDLAWTEEVGVAKDMWTKVKSIVAAGTAPAANTQLTAEPTAEPTVPAPGNQQGETTPEQQTDAATNENPEGSTPESALAPAPATQTASNAQGEISVTILPAESPQNAPRTLKRSQTIGGPLQQAPAQSPRPELFKRSKTIGAGDRDRKPPEPVPAPVPAAAAEEPTEKTVDQVKAADVVPALGAAASEIETQKVVDPSQISLDELDPQQEVNAVKQAARETQEPNRPLIERPAPDGTIPKQGGATRAAVMPFAGGGIIAVRTVMTERHRQAIRRRCRRRA